MNFSVHISPNFRGGQYFTSFDSDSADKALTAIKNAWFRSGLSADTGEAFLLATIKVADEAKKFELGTFKFYEDGEMFFDITSFDDEFTGFLDSTGFKSDEMLEGEESILALLTHIISTNRE
jgi:hypothetical protein